MSNLSSFIGAGNKELLKQYIRQDPVRDDDQQKILWTGLLRILSFKGSNQCSFEDAQRALGIHNEETKAIALDAAAPPRFVESSTVHKIHENQSYIKHGLLIAQMVEHNSPDIQYSPLVLPMIMAFLRHLDDKEVYELITTIISNSSSPNLPMGHNATNKMGLITEKLVKKYLPKIYSDLKQLATSAEPNPKGAVSPISFLFLTFHWTLFQYLRFDYFLAILDLYLIEGAKILYRSYLALVEVFWSIKGSQASNDFPNSLNKFCESINDHITIENLIKKMWDYRAFTGASLEHYWTKYQDAALALGHQSFVTSPSRGAKLPQPSVKIETAAPLLTDPIWKASSALLAPKHLRRLVTHEHMMPMVRITHCRPKLVYTTSEHGFSMSNFLHQCDQYEPLLMIVSTVEGAVFGAFCSKPWCLRREIEDEKKVAGAVSSNFFGDGATFVFFLDQSTADSHQIRVLPWIGKTNKTKESDPQARMFLSAKDSTLQIGSGGGGCALSIFDDLKRGSSSKCTTFENQTSLPELSKHGCSEDRQSTSQEQMFEISTLEAIAFDEL